jgi:protein-disulfide isomerase
MEQAQADQDRRDRQRTQQVIASRHAEIFDDPAAVSLGDPQGDVTLVEFFDYRCPFCKADAPVVDRLIAADPHLRVVLRELPVLGPESEYVAHLALAAGKQGRYHEFYNAVFAHMPAHAERKAVDQALQAAGFDPRKLAALSQAPEIEATIRQDLDLAKAIGIDGTPTWLVGNFIVPLDTTHPLEQQLAGYVDLVRKTAHSKPPSATP